MLTYTYAAVCIQLAHIYTYTYSLTHAQKYGDYSIKIVGHSLGAGAAALYGIILMEGMYTHRRFSEYSHTYIHIHELIHTLTYIHPHIRIHTHHVTTHIHTYTYIHLHILTHCTYLSSYLYNTHTTEIHSYTYSPHTHTTYYYILIYSYTHIHTCCSLTVQHIQLGRSHVGVTQHRV